MKRKNCWLLVLGIFITSIVPFTIYAKEDTVSKINVIEYNIYLGFKNYRYENY